MTSKETIDVTFLTNEHGLKFPVPLEFWPKGAMYASIDIEGETIFSEKMPTYKHGVYWYNDNCYNYGFMDEPEDNSKTFWTRPAL
jgi:hypothetical protein